MANDLIVNGSILITQYGGIAKRVINKTGGLSVYGEYVVPYSSLDDAVQLGTDSYAFLGTIYEAGVPDGSPMWVVTEGVAHYLLEASSASTRGQIIFPHPTAPGRVITSAVPSPPNADQHFKEQGHCRQTVAAGNLFLGFIHKN